jgi:hypothetical protein
MDTKILDDILAAVSTWKADLEKAGLPKDDLESARMHFRTVDQLIDAVKAEDGKAIAHLRSMLGYQITDSFIRQPPSYRELSSAFHRAAWKYPAPPDA